MIPYPDLVAALERWRLRNGLPVGGGGLPPMSASVPAPAPASYSSYAPPAAPRPSASMPVPPAAKVPARVQTEEPVDLGDDDVLDEDMLAPEGGDFAMAFGVSNAKPVDTLDDDVADERTAIGLPDAPTTSPFTPETHPGFDTLDADGEVLDEHDDPDRED
jgi:hypothetical protein